MARLGDLEFDVAKSERPTLQNTVTDRPIENESDISDHIKQNPITLQVTAVFSGREALGKYGQLSIMRASEEVYEYSGAFGIMPNMAIQDITALKDANYGDGYECTISLKKVRIATLEETEISLGVDPDTGEAVQGETTDGEAEEETAGEEETDEETLPPTSIKVFENHITDFFSGEEGEE